MIGKIATKFCFCIGENYQKIQSEEICPKTAIKECVLPDGVIHGESDALEEKAILEPGLVFEVVGVGQGALHALNAEGEGLL